MKFTLSPDTRVSLIVSITTSKTSSTYYNNEYSQKNIVLKKVKRNVNAEIKKLEKGEIIESEPRRKYKRKKER